jgi:AI-2 transport protein TqsA
MKPAPLSDAALRLLLGLAALMIIIAGLRAAQPVLVPFALAGFITITSLPLYFWLRQRRVPAFLAVPLVLLPVIGLLVAIGAIATNSLLEIREAMPRYAVTLTALYGRLLAWLANYRITLPEPTAEVLMNPTRVVNFATVFLRGFAGFMSLVFLVAIITLFLLAEAVGVPRKMRAAFGEDSSMQRYGRIMAQIQRYLAIKTVTSLATGILIGLWALLIGLDFPLFWGLLAFLLNYVPTIGSLIAAIPALLLAIVQLGPGGAALAAAGYIVVNTAIGNIIEPAVMGRGLGLSPVVVLLSLVFWGWVWGPIGMLLSLPLTMVVKILLENSENLAWVAVLLGPAPPEQRAVAFRPRPRPTDPDPVSARGE